MVGCTPSARQLFYDLADVSPEGRESFLANRQIPEDLRDEVESLLAYDSMAGESLTRRVSAVADEALRSSNGLPLRSCGPYRLVGLLGSGGMGAVYLAERRDGEIEQKVAIKLLRADANRPAWRDRFLRERQFLAYLNHPAIARMLDAGHTGDGRPYLVMEYVEGVAIDEYAAALDPRALLRLFLLVCDGVSHAHRHLIVHRDLKPSNILVNSSGHPKLLDFGIAKLLDGEMDETRTVERLLTPSYASPEQVRGDAQTTATDVYSLGAVLHKLLIGRSPHERPSDSSAASNPRYPRDIDHILRKALRHEPSERYASVDALAADIRAFLESRPVQARSGDTWYRVRKYVRRYRVAVAAATVAIVGLLSGLWIANHQRVIAQQRFLQVRQLAKKILALDQAIGGLDSSSKARHEIAAMSKEYLEALGAEAHTDQDLALEVGDAYSLLARVQGMSFSSSSSQRAQAEESLRKAGTFVDPILAADPANRNALLIAARIRHHRMTVAHANRRNDQTLAHSRQSAGHLDRLLARGEVSEVEGETASQLFYDISLTHKNLRLYSDAILYARRSIEAARFSPNPQLRLSRGLSMLADLLRRTGDLEGALQAVRDARNNLATARFPNEMVRRSSWAIVISREAKILGAPSGLSLGLPDEAIALFQRAFHLIEEWIQDDPEDTSSRMLFATLGRDLGDNVRLRDPRRALAIYDHALLRLREVKNNPEARRGEAELLAGSSYVLRQLNRFDESKERIDAAFRLLRETNDYPADRVNPHDPAEAALRAFGDHLAETGRPQQAMEAYQNLLDKIMMSNPDPQNDLGHAVALSQIYGSLAALDRRSGQRDRGKAFPALRRELWRHWDRKLPGNNLIRRQLESAPIH